LINSIFHKIKINIKGLFSGKNSERRKAGISFLRSADNFIQTNYCQPKPGQKPKELMCRVNGVGHRCPDRYA